MLAIVSIFSLASCQTMRKTENIGFGENYAAKPMPSPDFFNIELDKTKYGNNYVTASASAISPDGKNIVLWYPEFGINPFAGVSYSQPGKIILLDAVCLRRYKSFDSCQREGISAINNGITHLNWSDDSKSLFFIDYTFSLHQLRLNDSRTKFLLGNEIIKIQSNWEYRDTYSAFGATPSMSITEELARIKTTNSGVDLIGRNGIAGKSVSKIRSSIDRDGLIGFVYVNKADLGLGFIDNSKSEEIAFEIFSPELSASSQGIMRQGSIGKVARDKDKNSYLFGSGAILKIDARTANFENTNNNSFYETPILAATTGQIIGRFSDKSVTFFENKNLSTKFIAKIATTIGASEVLKNIQFTDDLKSAFVISHDISRGNIFRYFYFNSFANRFEVVAQEFATSLIVKDAKLELKNIGPNDWPLQARLYSREGAKNLVVYIPGGPYSTFAADSHWYQGAYEILMRNHDALVLSYSGSADDFEVSSRLRKYTYKALEKDAKLLGEYLRENKNKYEKIHLIAESFGGTIAPILVRDFPDVFDKSVLIAPLAKVRRKDEKEYYYKSRYREDSIYLERSFAGKEDESPDSFAKWLEELYASLDGKSNVMIIQGDDDKRSMPSDIPVSNNVIRIVNKLGHSGFNNYIEKGGLIQEFIFEDKEYKK